jgi:hypothetical protein
MIELFVGDNGQEPQFAATNKDTTAFLVDSTNYKKFLNSQDQNLTVYTSFSDLPKITADRSIFFEVLGKADIIYYCPPARWSDHADHFVWTSQQQMTEYYLYLINLQKNNVNGLDLSGYKQSSYLKLADQSNSDNKKLWIAGCSVSHGVGVAESERFGNLIAKQFELPQIQLTLGGSSLSWSADQILRSDIAPGDILIWGLTSENRAPRADSGQVAFESDPTVLMSETQLYRALTCVHQVINFCRKINCRLILLPVLCSEHLQLALHGLPEYCQTFHVPGFLDKGTDNQHPGPLQHEAWADICVKLLKDSNR